MEESSSHQPKSFNLVIKENKLYFYIIFTLVGLSFFGIVVMAAGHSEETDTAVLPSPSAVVDFASVLGANQKQQQPPKAPIKKTSDQLGPVENGPFQLPTPKPSPQVSPTQTPAPTESPNPNPIQIPLPSSSPTATPEVTPSPTPGT